jgi:large subunit ribosomal protein L30
MVESKKPAAKAKKAPAKRAKAARAAKAAPAAKKAKPAPAPQGADLRVKQVRSGIGHAFTYRRTLEALGLRHHQAEIVVQDTPSTRGMLHKVRHLVRVAPVEA